MKTLILLIFLIVTGAATSQPVKNNDSIINSLKASFKLSEYDHPQHIIGFNKDTVLVAGYLSGDAVYQTFNGGKIWRMQHFNGAAWIYDFCFRTDGKAWMGGSDEYVHYSHDYGTTWVTLPKPLSPVNRVLSIYMEDTVRGIAGGLQDGLAVTANNWQTAWQVPTPLDQKMYTISKGSSRNRVDAAGMLGSVLLVNQNEHIYFTRTANISWQPFNVPTTGFSINQADHTIRLFGIAGNEYVLDSNLALLKKEKNGERYYFSLPPNDTFGLAPFIGAGIKSIKIKAVGFDFDKMSGGCMPFALYKEKVRHRTIGNKESISRFIDILYNTETFLSPEAGMFEFSEDDWTDYQNYYHKTLQQRADEKKWGGDFTAELPIDGDDFTNPKQAAKILNQALLDTVYRTFAYRYFTFTASEPYLVLTIVNDNGDTVRISSKNAGLFSLPWTIEFKEHSFNCYDTRITAFLRRYLPKDYNYYNKLFAGELIYRLIEQKMIDRLVYKQPSSTKG